MEERKITRTQPSPMGAVFGGCNSKVGKGDKKREKDQAEGEGGLSIRGNRYSTGTRVPWRGRILRSAPTTTPLPEQVIGCLLYALWETPTITHNCLRVNNVRPRSIQ